MDLKEQLQQLFPEHEPTISKTEKIEKSNIWIQDNPIICKYEIRNGKPVSILEGYTGTSQDFKKLTKTLKKTLGVGGSFKNEQIIIQGNYRNKVMTILKEIGFKVKRVGG